MTLRLVLLLGVMLAGCAGNTPEAQCQRQAAQDPEVQNIYARTSGYYTFTGEQRDDLAQATRQAVMRCMRAKGLAPPGGVQPIMPHW